MRRYYFHTEVLELRRSMIVLEKNTLLRVTYAIIVYTNTRLETVPIPSEVLFTKRVLLLKQKFVLTNTNKITQMIILSHFRNKIATYVENSKLLLEKLLGKTFRTKITISEIENNHFRCKITISQV